MNINEYDFIMALKFVWKEMGGRFIRSYVILLSVGFNSDSMDQEVNKTLYY